MAAHDRTRRHLTQRRGASMMRTRRGKQRAAGIQWGGLTYVVCTVGSLQRRIAWSECVARDGQEDYAHICDNLSGNECELDASAAGQHCCWRSHREGGGSIGVCKETSSGADDVLAFLGVLAYATMLFCACGAVWAICRRLSEQQEERQRGAAQEARAAARGPRNAGVSGGRAGGGLEAAPPQWGGADAAAAPRNWELSRRQTRPSASPQVVTAVAVPDVRRTPVSVLETLVLLRFKNLHPL